MNSIPFTFFKPALSLEQFMFQLGKNILKGKIDSKGQKLESVKKQKKTTNKI
ncbi:MAG: hypothetical protein ACT4OD_05305 [Candidatus Nitrosotenuis sp.]